MPNENTSLIPSAKIMEKYNSFDDNAKNHTEKVPAEVMILIFIKLTIKELGIAATVCKKWNELVNNDQVWRQKIIEEYPQYGQSDLDSELFGNKNASTPKTFKKLSEIQKPKQALRDTFFAKKKLSEVNKLEQEFIAKYSDKEQFATCSGGGAMVGGVPTGAITYCVTENLWRVFQNGVAGASIGFIAGALYDCIMTRRAKSAESKQIEDARNEMNGLFNELVIPTSHIKRL